MIVLQYSEIDEDSAVDGRAREMELLDRALDLLGKAEADGAQSLAGVEAVHFTVRLWSMLLEDLASNENALPDQLRASLISIGIWIIKECERIRQGESDNIRGVKDVTQTIRDGY